MQKRGIKVELMMSCCSAVEECVLLPGVRVRVAAGLRRAAASLAEVSSYQGVIPSLLAAFDKD